MPARATKCLSDRLATKIHPASATASLHHLVTHHVRLSSCPPLHRPVMPALSPQRDQHAPNGGRRGWCATQAHFAPCARCMDGEVCLLLTVPPLLLYLPVRSARKVTASSSRWLVAIGHGPLIVAGIADADPVRAASERKLQARTRPTLAPQSASSPYGPPPPTANHHPNLDCTPRTDRIRVPCTLTGSTVAAFAVRGRCGRRRAAASVRGAWATTMACALRPARAAETRRIPAAAAAAVVAGAMRIRCALYECMRRGRCDGRACTCRDARVSDVLCVAPAAPRPRPRCAELYSI